MDGGEHCVPYLERKPKREARMATQTRDGERWTQDQIDAVEKAKEQQRRREQEANKKREADSQSRQAENRQ